jgi:hypothetical protein
VTNNAFNYFINRLAGKERVDISSFLAAMRAIEFEVQTIFKAGHHWKFLYFDGVFHYL